MIPQLKVLREPSQPDWTLSEFFINGKKSGVGVEDEKRIENGEKKVFGETRVQSGIYEIKLVDSPKFSGSFFVDENGYLNATKTARFSKPHKLIHVKNVPQFENILWHWGNTDLDTHGCYIVGSSFATFDKRKGVSGSKTKYIDVYPIIFQMIRENEKKGIKTFVEYADRV